MSDVIANRTVVYNAPDTNPADNDYCRRFLFPNDPALIAAVNDVLAFLIHDGVWRRSSDVLDTDMQSIVANALNDQTTVRCNMIQVPIGTILPYLRDTSPPGCLPLDGTMYAADDYPNLYAVIPDNFKVGDDSFVLPDMRGRVFVGESASHAIGSSGGEETHTLTTGEMPSHTHAQDAHAHTYNVPTATTGTNPNGFTNAANKVLGTLTTANATATNQNTGGGGSHNNMQPFGVVSYCIVAE